MKKNIFKIQLKDLKEMYLWQLCLLIILLPIFIEIIVFVVSSLLFLLSGGHISISNKTSVW